jgi:hypothetical protein
MIVFAVYTGNAECYPPHGLRVEIHTTWDNLTSDIMAFAEVIDADDKAGPEVFNRIKTTFDSRDGNAIIKLMDEVMNEGGSLLPWSIYSRESGYLEADFEADSQDTV